MTPYKKAWERWRESWEFDRLMELEAGPDRPARSVLENRLRWAFDAGWNAAQQAAGEGEG